jgi:hypothetical protein
LAKNTEHDLGGLFSTLHERHADAGADAGESALQAKRMGDARQDLPQQGLALLAARQRHDQGELVAAHARRGGVVRQRAPQATCDFAQHGIATDRAELVVDVAQSIEIEVAHRHQPRAVVRHGAQRKILDRRHAIGQAGERVAPLQQAQAFGAQAGGRGNDGPEGAAVFHALAAHVDHHGGVAARAQRDARSLRGAARGHVDVL